MKKNYLFIALLFVSTLMVSANITPNQMINIAGKQRMLSQKLAKVYLMKAYGANLPELNKELKIGKIIFENNIKTLSINAQKMFSDQVRSKINKEIVTWENFKIYLEKPVNEVFITKILELSNKLLTDTDEVVKSLQNESFMLSDFKISDEVLQTIDLSGKQRMLSQRLCVYFIAKKLFLKRKEYNETVENYLKSIFNELDETLVTLLSKEINNNKIDEAIGSTLIAFEKIREQRHQFLTGTASMNMVYDTTNELTNLYDGLTSIYAELDK
ncbi:type IV pili methyl-accepting chemotaxis transducer N-terminal domain-containing protein [Aquimarina agarivorans]|uniref:type IV pili methyl-accepting chemotaxis transducer N-terminal domain-containing protein n=1 Tax=Aquimarina agarivorans TaxID=980584 RepID=UPI000248FB60|nr:type IV pili methyl-accepting chemotaxis transducer N-terminal domain-containing protein [Aquimarina agarivorans]